MSLIDKNIVIDFLKYRDQLKSKKENDKSYLFDPIRKKNIILQPEELVRQLCILWLINNQEIHRNAIQVEKLININGLSRRFDIVVYDKEIKPFILIECKSPTVKIKQATFDQIAMYQMALKAPFLIVTNGLDSYIAEINHEDKKYNFYPQVPEWKNRVG